ncbi:MAG: tRNA adenosine(34) deaminase TadA [Xanthomonadales bacterium]|nr:tRNA adenosine(34) deaminase TadA [Xanthomonadales bacterium]
MSKAIEQALKAESIGEVPVGAVIVKNNELIATGYNQVITLNDSSAHAEVMALRNAGSNIGNYRVVDTTLYVTLEPCMMCAGAMVYARISRLVFGAFDQKTGVISSRDDCFDKPYHNHKVEYQGGVLADECAQLLKDFFKGRRSLKS